MEKTARDKNTGTPHLTGHDTHVINNSSNDRRHQNDVTNDTPSQPPLLAPPGYFETTLSEEPLPITRIFPEELTENDPRLELYDDRDGVNKTKDEKQVFTYIILYNRNYTSNM